MLPIKIVLKQILRSPALLSVIIYTVPSLALIVLGIVWLAENDWLFQFVSITLTLILLLRLFPLFVRYRRRTQEARSVDADHTPLVSTNPEWTERELSVFGTLCAGIKREPRPWRDLQVHARVLVEEAAQQLSGGQKTALDFSIPEALLLADRVIIRLRHDLREMVPFSDRISLKTIFWIWENKGWFQYGATWAGRAWRVKRMITNPPGAILQEIQGAVTSGADGGEFKNISVAIVQQIVLEEIARAAVDLHSGHLRFTDEELLEIELGSADIDKRILARPDEPIRLLVIGQVSAGKSTVINQLAGTSIAETDMAPTTPDLIRHAMKIDGISYSVVDSQGLDGSEDIANKILAQALDCDHILWVVRANRPARAPDVELLGMIDVAFAGNPLRRVPPITLVANAVDQLLPAWPFPEHLLPAEAQATIAAATHAIALDLSGREALPLASEGHTWNIDQLRAAVAQSASEALSTQRNRRRIIGAEASSSLWQEASRGGIGVRQASRLVAKKFLNR